MVQRFTRAQPAEGLSWWDVLGLALLAGIGFTVSLLIGELAFGAHSESDDHVKIAVLLGSLTSALLAAIVLRIRNGHYRRICAAEEADHDGTACPTSTCPTPAQDRTRAPPLRSTVIENILRSPPGWVVVSTPAAW